MKARVENVIEEASKPTGTWGYTYLVDLHHEMKKAKDRDYITFISGLLDYINDQDTEVLQIFKIAQLISSLRSQNPHRAQDLFDQRKEETTKRISTLPDSKLTFATKRLTTCIFAVKAQETSTRLHDHIRAFSQEPRNTYAPIRSFTPPPPPK